MFEKIRSVKLGICMSRAGRLAVIKKIDKVKACEKPCAGYIVTGLKGSIVVLPIRWSSTGAYAAGDVHDNDIVFQP